LKHFEIEFDPMAGVSEEIDEALKRGDKIQAIKLYREATDVSLKEGKDYIEELQRR
jgi:ribosomal protein L7/L12